MRSLAATLQNPNAIIILHCFEPEIALNDILKPNYPMILYLTRKEK